MEFKQINLDEWELFSDRHNSLVYASRDGKQIVKFFNTGFGGSVAELLEEQRVARACCDLGIVTPAPGDIVTSGDNIGLIYERIANKKSLARMLKENPSCADEVGRRFGRAAKELHETPCNTEVFPNHAEYLKKLVSASRNIGDEDRARVLRFLDSIPPATTCIHGDLHPSNIVTDGKKLYFIDLGRFAYGNPLLDVGIFYMFSNLVPPFVTQAVFYSTKETARTLWEGFAKEYFGISADEEMKALDKKITPYAGLNAFVFEVVRNEPFVKGIVESAVLPYID